MQYLLIFFIIFCVLPALPLIAYKMTSEDTDTRWGFLVIAWLLTIGLLIVHTKIMIYLLEVLRWIFPI